MDPPTPDQVARLRKLLLRKGAEINEKLTALLAGQTLSVEDLVRGGKSKPGESPIERLRRFMRIIDGSLQAIKEGRYGRCLGCGDALPFAQLEQVPWIDTCPACFAKEQEQQ